MCSLVEFGSLIECHASRNNRFGNWEQLSMILTSSRSKLWLLFIQCWVNNSYLQWKSLFVFRLFENISKTVPSVQLAKTGPPVTTNFPLLRLFPSDAMMAWRFYTPYDVNRTNLHILTARGMSHLLSWIGQLWSSRKNSYVLVRTPNSEIANQRIINFNNLEWKSTFPI